ncbi:MAG: hypothetical protein AB1394_10325, partial [Bacteroidota bacterium]
MSYSNKIDSSRKVVYTIASVAILLVIITSIANVLIKNRINTLYTSVYSSAIKVETHISKARSAALITLANPAAGSKKEAWDELSQGELLSVALTKEKHSFVMSLLPFDDLAFRASVQKMQEYITEYRGQFAKVFDKANAPTESLMK